MVDLTDSTTTGGPLPSLADQRLGWNKWDKEFLGTVSAQKAREMETALSLLRTLNLQQPQILEVGCANGWLSGKLTAYGQVTGVDIADEAIAEARRRVAGATFLAQDCCSVDLPPARFDVAVTLGTLAHVWDQPAFIRNIALSLKPAAHLILLTQNRLVFKRRSDIVPLGPGQIRHWLSMAQLRTLVTPHFRIVRTFTIQPSGHMGFLRFVNSSKVNTALSLVIPRSALESLKEWAGLGQMLVLLAQRRSSGA